jgi:hypothetical protein
MVAMIWWLLAGEYGVCCSSCEGVGGAGVEILVVVVPGVWW